MLRVVLVGNPNVGKSMIFSQLTGARVVASNYPGTTVEYTRGYLRLPGGERVEVVDAPGTYSLEPTCKAEEVAVNLIASADVVVNVVDATNLERNLYLTLQLLERGTRLIVALNLSDEAEHRGVRIDPGRLEAELGVPVVSTAAVAGRGLKELAERLREARATSIPTRSTDERWVEIGRLTGLVQTICHRHHTWLEVLQDLSLRPITGIPVACLVLYACFKAVVFIGEGLGGYALEPLLNLAYRPIVGWLSSILGGSGFLHDVLIGRNVNGLIDFENSFGVLTTGIYVEFVSILPYLIGFYIILGFLEDSGYLPRLAVMLDRLFHKAGLHGYAIVPMLMGFGCNVPGLLATRNLESRRERFIASVLLAVGVPCVAQIAMMVALLGKAGGGYLAVVFASLFAVWVLLGLALDRMVGGITPSILVEIPPYRMPHWKVQLKKVWVRISWFVLDATPYILGGILAVNLLHGFGVIGFVGGYISPLLGPLFGLPGETVSALFAGLLRKDVAVALLMPLELSPKQVTIAAVILTTYFPCVATFFVLVKELGLRDMLKAVGVMAAVVLIAGSFLNLVLDRLLSPQYTALVLAAGAAIAGVLVRGRSESAEFDAHEHERPSMDWKGEGSI